MRLKLLEEILSHRDTAIKELANRVKAREILLEEAIKKEKAALEKSLRCEKELMQVRNAHVSYVKDLANLNVKMETQKKKIEGVLDK